MCTYLHKRGKRAVLDCCLFDLAKSQYALISLFYLFIFCPLLNSFWTFVGLGELMLVLYCEGEEKFCNRVTV
jgi:hypothetical protein